MTLFTEKVTIQLNHIGQWFVATIVVAVVAVVGQRKELNGRRRHGREGREQNDEHEQRMGECACRAFLA